MVTGHYAAKVLGFISVPIEIILGASDVADARLQVRVFLGEFCGLPLRGSGGDLGMIGHLGLES